MGLHFKTWTWFIQVIFAVSGLVGNALIIILNVKHVVTERRLSPREKLIISLGLANLCLQITMAANDTFYNFWYQYYMLEYVGKSFFIMGMTEISVCLWISTWYCIYCCIKITNSHRKVVMWLQQQIPKMVTWLIIGSVLTAMAQSLPAINDLYVIYQNISSISQQNTTETGVGFRSKCSCSLYIYIGISLVAFILFFIATVCILHSLWNHVRNIEGNGFNVGNHQFHKLFRAAVTVTSLLILCITFYTAQFLLFLSLVVYESLFFWICMTLISMYTSINSVTLIMGNQKLKQSVIDLFMKMIGK